MVDRRVEARQRRTVYRLRALTHPLQGFAAAFFVFGLVVSARLSVAVLAAVLVELVLVGALPCVAAFRRAVDEGLARAASEAASRARANALVRMSEAHRAELERIEGLAAALRDEAGPRAVSTGRDGLDDLLEAYAVLAIAHRESARAFAPRLGGGTDGASERLEPVVDADDAETVEWAARRARVLHAREQVRKAADAERQRIGEQLATIVAVVEWVYESNVLDRTVRAREEAALDLWSLVEAPGGSAA